MNKYNLLVLLFVIGFMSCKKADTENKKAYTSGELVHLVYFNVKNDSLTQDLIEEIEKLKEIESIKNLDMGIYKDLDDPRAIAGYDIVMILSFKNLQSYQDYQINPIHLLLKDATADLVAGPPLTYDFVAQ